MKKTHIQDVARACKGRLFGNGEAFCRGVVIDSRAAKEGDLFVCIVGEKNNGHDYAKSAYAQGCRLFLMSDVDACGSLLQDAADASVILVKDTTPALRSFARQYLAQFPVKRVAVTGSVGKTTTKSLTASVLSQKYRTVCTQKNLNTDLGLCLTCFLADETTEAVVFEMGMDRSGEIEEYCEWVQPEVCMITNIGISHLERLGSKEAIAKAKLEITKHMTADMPLIYNSDSPFLDEKSLKELTLGNFLPVPVGTGPDARVRLSDAEDCGLEGIRFTLTWRGQRQQMRLPLLGLHNAENAALACACGLIEGLSLEECAAGLLAAVGTERRLACEELAGIYLLDDSYNASPASMSAALDVLRSLPANRRIAVLGDMNELGDEELRGHELVGAKAARSGVDLLIAIGRNASVYAKAAHECSLYLEVREFSGVEEALPEVLGLLSRGDAVLIKGSNSTGVSRIAEAIRGILKA